MDHQEVFGEKVGVSMVLPSWGAHDLFGVFVLKYAVLYEVS